MILDAGICQIYRVDKQRGPDGPADGLMPLYDDWYGILRSESGAGSEPGDVVIRIRIHDCDATANDILYAAGQYWTITRSFHGIDDDTAMPIADLTLERGARHFVPIDLQAVDEGIERGKIVREEGQTRRVYGHVSAIGESEFYSASQAGYELECSVTVYAAEYGGESRLRFNGVNYRVVRKTLNVSAGTIVLGCERVKGRG